MHDDFANDKEIQRQRKEQALYKEMVGGVFKTISGKLHLKQLDQVEDIDEFHMISSLSKYSLQKAYGSEKVMPDIKTLLLSYEHYVFQGKGGRVGGVDEYLFGLVTLNKEYPTTYIYPETIKEKLADVFIKQECDFPEQKKFCRRYYVLTEDKEKLSATLLSRPLDELASIRQLELEFRGNKCLFRRGRKSIAMNQAEKFCDAAVIIHKVFN